MEPRVSKASVSRSKRCERRVAGSRVHVWTGVSDGPISAVLWGPALLRVALGKKWVIQDLDSRVLDITRLGRREILSRFGVQV